MPTDASPQIKSIVAQKGAKYGVEPALILAHMKRESDFRPDVSREEYAINDASIGLMQVLVKTAQWMMNDNSITRAQLFNMDFNIEVGVKYISYNMKRFPTDIKKAIASYNSGSPKYNSDGTFINQAYVDFVYGWYLRYKNDGTSVPMSMPSLPGISPLPTFTSSGKLEYAEGHGPDGKEGDSDILPLLVIAAVVLL